jgi:glyoxylase-like metal-dependent hydrolase (beta-lactamase superfamily II)
VAAVVLTHAHPDHLGSAEYFRSVVGTPVLVHEAEVPNATGRQVEQVSVATLLARVWRPDAAVWTRDALLLKAARVQRLASAETFAAEPLDIPGRPVPVHTPGHTSGHAAFHLPERGAVLAGDALMTEHALVKTPGPQLLPAFFNHDNDQALQSLHLLAGLDADVVVPGHGPPFTGTPAEAVAGAVAAAAAGPVGGRSVRLTYGAVIPLPPEQAFAFVTDPLNWPSFFSSMRGARKDADWGSVGGRAQMRTVVLGRTVASDLEMTVWDPPHEFGYVSRQASAPALTNHRVLEPVPGGTRLSGTTEVTLRPGLPGLVDGVQERALRRMYAAAMARLPDAARASLAATSE